MGIERYLERKTKQLFSPGDAVDGVFAPIARDPAAPEHTERYEEVKIPGKRVKWKDHYKHPEVNEVGRYFAKSFTDDDLVGVYDILKFLDSGDESSDEYPRRSHALSELLVFGFERAAKIDDGVYGDEAKGFAAAVDNLLGYENAELVEHPLARFEGRPPEGLIDYIKVGDLKKVNQVLRPGVYIYDPSDNTYEILLCARIGITE